MCGHSGAWTTQPSRISCGSASTRCDGEWASSLGWSMQTVVRSSPTAKQPATVSSCPMGIQHSKSVPSPRSSPRFCWPTWSSAANCPWTIRSPGSCPMMCGYQPRPIMRSRRETWQSIALHCRASVFPCSPFTMVFCKKRKVAIKRYFRK